MKWEKKGLIFSPSGQYPWMVSHASLPVSLNLSEHIIRVYFASRDSENRSHICFIEFNPSEPQHILRICKKPVLEPGHLGCFDDYGVYPASIVEYDQKLYMYYIGWNPGKFQPLFYSSIGLAISDDYGESFQKKSLAPIMSRSDYDPCLVTSPCVILDNNKWRMWYVSGFKWEKTGDELHSYYHIKYAESTDGINWTRNGLICIDLLPQERNIARPCVIKENKSYKMWYSYNKGYGYRIGYAFSEDGYQWLRDDNQNHISLSKSGWDSNGLAYPWVFNMQSSKFMLYNGNSFGKSGFGLALLQK